MAKDITNQKKEIHTQLRDIPNQKNEDKIYHGSQVLKYEYWPY